MKKHVLPLAVLVFVLTLAAFPSRSYFSFSGLEMVEIASDSSRPLLPPVPYPYSDSTVPFILNLGLGSGYEPTGTATVTDEGGTLGRVLFYDTRLSDNHTISCASCHLPEFGFSDSARFSKGFNQEVTHRNSMGLANARLQPSQRFFWDASEDTMQVQVFAALQSEIEMGMDLDTLVDRIQNTDFYPALFQQAFGSPQVTADRIAGAIAQFVLSMKSANSKYDIGFIMAMGNTLDPFPNFSDAENRGKEIFFSIPVACSHCHVGNNFTMFSPANNGLEMVYDDKGLGEVTGFASDMAMFKAPSLRNIALTAPYMHDGRFQTLEEVVEHYNSGVMDHPNLGDPLKEWNNNVGGLKPKRMNLTQQNKADLVAFLETLTDNYFLTDPRWQNPFTISEVADLPIHPTDTMPFGSIGFPFNLDSEADAAHVRLMGNPVVEQLKMELDNPKHLEVYIRLTNVEGKLVKELTGRSGSLTVDVEDLSSGNYVLQVKHPDFVHTEQIVKQ